VLSAERRKVFSADEVVKEIQLEVPNHIPPLAGIHNRLGWGLWLK